MGTLTHDQHRGDREHHDDDPERLPCGGAGMAEAPNHLRDALRTWWNSAGLGLRKQAC
jgi:hypothetical protein